MNISTKNALRCFSLFFVLFIMGIIALFIKATASVKYTGVCTNCSFNEKRICYEAKEVRSGTYYKVTEKGVCVADYVCKYFSGCESTHGGQGSWSILKNESPETFNIEKIPNSEAYMIHSLRGTFFWLPTKGNGRERKVDFNSFEYLGGQYYKDKDGIYHGNSLISKADHTSFKFIGEQWAKDKNGYFYQGKKTSKIAPF